MLNELYSIFHVIKSKMGFVNAVATVEQIVQLFEVEFKEDHNARNAAIDCVIKLLETHKVKPAEADATTTQPPNPPANA